MEKNMEYIYQIYLDGSFSQAAKNLYISQPALSAIVYIIRHHVVVLIPHQTINGGEKTGNQ